MLSSNQFTSNDFKNIPKKHLDDRYVTRAQGTASPSYDSPEKGRHPRSEEPPPQSRKIKKGVIITTPRAKQSRAHSIALEIMHF